jgi:ribosomal protein S18 acetylase RimI-like enzyme
VVGTIIAGWDGWRASIYRLAVHPGHRRQGLARQLLSEAGTRLANLGADRTQAIVVASDRRATGFRGTSGWEQQSDRLRFVKG